MKLLLAIAFSAMLTACPQPVAPKPDASDASALGDSPPSPESCQAACDALRRVGCIVLSDCVATLRNTIGNLRDPKTGMRLTCDDVAKVNSAADVLAIGQACGPSPDVVDASAPVSKPKPSGGRKR